MTDTPAAWLALAGESDLESVLAMERRVFSHPWTADHFRHDLVHGDVLVLRSAAGDLLAYAVCRVVWDELQVLNLAVSPDHRRRGLGRRLLRLVLRLGVQRGAEVALLEVRQGNTSARCLYEAEGFRLAGQRRGYYRDPPEDALLLERRALTAAAGRQP
jgi:ribosomal-protein-alanine N-acetyltransferase